MVILKEETMGLLILKIFFLMLAVMYGFSNLFKAIMKGPFNSINNMQMFLMSVGIVGFIVLQWLI